MRLPILVFHNDNVTLSVGRNRLHYWHNGTGACTAQCYCKPRGKRTKGASEIKDSDSKTIRKGGKRLYTGKIKRTVVVCASRRKSWAPFCCTSWRITHNWLPAYAVRCRETLHLQMQLAGTLIIQEISEWIVVFHIASLLGLQVQENGTSHFRI